MAESDNAGFSFLTNKIVSLGKQIFKTRINKISTEITTLLKKVAVRITLHSQMVIPVRLLCILLHKTDLIEG